MNEIITGNFAPFRLALWPPDSIRVVDWNIDRGLKLAAIIDFLGKANADILILQEVDLNAGRTQRLNIAQEIARQLKMNYVFGREFEELTQGSKASPAYHGQATLSRWSISNPRLIRFRKQSTFWQPRWFLPQVEPFQERLGGRIALIADIDVAGEKIVTYNLHLESRGNDDLRLSQVDEVLRDASVQDPSKLLIVAGDFNLDISRPGAGAVLTSSGFREAAPTSNLPTTTSRGFFEGGRHIDWAFVSGAAEADRGKVHTSVKASDHYPISFNLRRAGSSTGLLGRF
jgi:endonuclease/exonuclease/phosphatase family metal-dependent hydrolase